jgi:hypothetical protein
MPPENFGGLNEKEPAPPGEGLEKATSAKMRIR